MWLAHDTGPVCGGCRMLLFISCSVSVEPLGMDSSFDGANPCIVHTVQWAFVSLLLVLPSTGCLPDFCFCIGSACGNMFVCIMLVPV